MNRDPASPPRALADEFRRQPLGRHSPGLQSVLTKFRGEQMEGKYVLVCTRPHAEWRLGQLSGVRGESVTICTLSSAPRLEEKLIDLLGLLASLPEKSIVWPLAAWASARDDAPNRQRRCLSVARP